MAKDLKYGEVTTERGTIGTDEPVFVLRAQDKLSHYVIEAYRQMAQEAGSPQRHLDNIEAAFQQFVSWQAVNFTKIPESLPATEEPRPAS